MVRIFMRFFGYFLITGSLPASPRQALSDDIQSIPIGCWSCGSSQDASEHAAVSWNNGRHSAEDVSHPHLHQGSVHVFVYSKYKRYLL